MPYWHEHDSDSSPRSIWEPTMVDFESWTVESKITHKARDVIYHTKQVDHDVDVRTAWYNLWSPGGRGQGLS
eukprot:2816670-Prorocentrum_lima.AAC.1